MGEFCDFFFGAIRTKTKKHHGLMEFFAQKNVRLTKLKVMKETKQTLVQSIKFHLDSVWHRFMTEVQGFEVHLMILIGINTNSLLSYVFLRWSF